MFTGPQGIAIRLSHGLKAAALGVSLVLSALLTAVALHSPDHHWLAWISFLPLFIAVRSLRPCRAAMAGGMWGGCLYVFSMVALTPPLGVMVLPIDPTAAAVAPLVYLLALMIVIPAIYVALAARPTWAMGYKLLTLSLGWVLLEVVLVTTYTNTPEPRALARAVLQNQDYSYSLHQGLLTGSQGEGPYVHWFARLLGYVCTALLVACVNASLVGVLSGVRLGFPARRTLPGSPNAVRRLASQVVLAIQSWSLSQAYPRAPPIKVAATT